MNHDKNYYRIQRIKHIKRKKRMMREWSLNGNCLQLTTPDGTLNKGKIHCSCWMCRKKSYDKKTAKDTARIEAMDESEQYYYSDFGYGYELCELSEITNDSMWHWIQVEENWYYEEDFYYEWLEDHPDGSTD